MVQNRYYSEPKVLGLVENEETSDVTWKYYTRTKPSSRPSMSQVAATPEESIKSIYNGEPVFGSPVGPYHCHISPLFNFLRHNPHSLQ